ncbi:MAG: histone deacetylase [Acidimicrobiia bacterium]|nr:histone deacetylase [Acidimicrobiia bacterium]MBT8216799.1 histone deacetylase [Acidimicrobiia bacterium]NNF11281.1 histone deacetylase [Acidimicrobiia bacterium]NNL68368.1 histone deacetylase [Acidimicrobiia bacterium]
MRVLHLTHPLFAEHSNGAGHPERPERLGAVEAGVRHASGVELIEAEPSPVDLDALGRVHEPRYIAAIESFCKAGGGALDPDTGAVPNSWGAALRAAGAGLDAVARLENGEADAAFLTVRPPGHHALAARAMGFCLFNNVAVLASSLLAEGHRVAIVDWDVHHGNGTQAMFYDEPNLLYLSTHQFPAYPGTGWFDELGEGPARGTNLNLPLPAKTAGDVVRAAFEALAPVVGSFAPDWVLVSAGYDAHERDPLAELRLIEPDYGLLGRAVAEMAPPGKLVFFLEGGYDLGALKRSVAATLEGAAGHPPPGRPLTSPPSAHSFLDQALEAIAEATG